MKIHSFSRFPVVTLLLAAFIAAANSSAWACSACYGDTTGSRIGKAAQVGIFAMVVIMLFMLGAVGLFMRHLAYRAKNPLPDYSELLSDEGHDLPPQPEAL